MKYNLIALACALLLAAGLSLTVTAGPLPDTDGDTVPDVHDNCVTNSNTSQGDIDQDGYGQQCDCDYNQNGKCDVIDFVTFPAGFGAAGEPDMNCNGKVDVLDFVTFQAKFGQPPGVSGQTCASLAKGSCPGNKNTCP
jgi:hypothetical protein